MIQTSKNQHWVDESGNLIPYKRITPLEKLQENELSKIVKDAKNINTRLITFKSSIKKACDKIIAEFMAANSVESIGKGNVTLYNFDRSIKLELDVNERIEFDDMTMKACKEKFDAFLSDNIDEKQAFVKDLVNDAFSTSRGKLDAKKVMSLLKYETRIQDPTFQEALKLMKQSIRRPDSKSYYRIWVKDEAGKYKNIDLNFSSI